MMCCGRGAYIHSKSSTMSMTQAWIRAQPRSAPLVNGRPGKPLVLSLTNITLERGVAWSLRRRVSEG
jgi:hypothetical protein